MIARALAQRLSEEWGQPVLVENKGGANNQVGTTAVARSAPDGYTLLLTPEHTFTVNPFLYRKLSYDPAKEFVPDQRLVSISQSLAVHPSLVMQTVGELITLPKSQARPVELRQPGCRLGSASEHGDAAVHERGETHAGAIQGRRTRTHRRVAGHIPMMFVSTGLIVQPGRRASCACSASAAASAWPSFPTADRRRDPARASPPRSGSDCSPQAELRGTSWSRSTPRSSASSPTALSATNSSHPISMSRCRFAGAIRRRYPPR